MLSLSFYLVILTSAWTLAGETALPGPLCEYFRAQLEVQLNAAPRAFIAKVVCLPYPGKLRVNAPPLKPSGRES